MLDKRRQTSFSSIVFFVAGDKEVTISKVFGNIMTTNIHSSYEIDHFVEIHLLCKLCAILRSRVLRVVASRISSEGRVDLDVEGGGGTIFIHVGACYTRDARSSGSLVW